MRSETAVTLALLGLYRRKEGKEVGYRSEVLDILLDLQDKHGIGTLGVRFRATPAGVRSDDLSGFVGRLSMSGYLVQESPIRLTDPGVALLREHVKARLGEPDVAKAAVVLELDELVKVEKPSPAV
jgi:hypothetical protein